MTTYDYDSKNRVVGISNPFSETTTIAYDAMDRELEKVFGNGMTVSHTFDAAGRETVRSHATAAGLLLTTYTAVYDAVGNMLNSLELDGQSITCTYDRLGQFLHLQDTLLFPSGTGFVTTNDENTYTWDAVGNMVGLTDRGLLNTYTYNAADELTHAQFSSPGEQSTYTWDANGNLLVEAQPNLSSAPPGTTTYTWDDENRLITALYGGSGNGYGPTQIETYTYAADGRRRKRIDASNVFYQYIWDEENLLLWTDQNGVTQRQHTDLPGVWGGMVSQRSPGVSSFFAHDLRGNTRKLVTSGGVVTAAYSYYEFGGQATVPSALTPFQYGGQFGYQLDTRDRFYVRNRQKSAFGAGRWLSRDPLGLKGGDWNLYRYVRNRPLVAVDPLGLVETLPGVEPSAIIEQIGSGAAAGEAGAVGEVAAAGEAGFLGGFGSAFAELFIAPTVVISLPAALLIVGGFLAVSALIYYLTTPPSGDAVQLTNAAVPLPRGVSQAQLMQDYVNDDYGGCITIVDFGNNYYTLTRVKELMDNNDPNDPNDECHKEKVVPHHSPQKAYYDKLVPLLTDPPNTLTKYTGPCVGMLTADHDALPSTNRRAPLTGLNLTFDALQQLDANEIEHQAPGKYSGGIWEAQNYMQTYFPNLLCVRF